MCRADVNHDGFLERAELKVWIMAKVQEHLAEAAAENAKIFHHLDTDSDGKAFMCIEQIMQLQKTYIKLEKFR